MSAIRPEQLKVASAFMNDFWQNFLKPYYNPEDTEGWWDMAIKKFGEIGEKYCNEDLLLREILMGAFKGLERVSKVEKGKGQ